MDIGNGERESDMKTVCTCTRVLCAATISIQECGPLLLARYLELLREEESEHDRFAVWLCAF